MSRRLLPAPHAPERRSIRPGGTPRASTRERGAALLVGLVLLLVMTILGVSAMNTATLELTMAGNAQAQDEAFQAAETGIDMAISRGAFSTLESTTIPETSVGNGSVEVETTFVQATNVPDRAFSMGVGVGGSVQAFHFEIVATGKGPRGATSTHRQGFYVLGPGGP